MRNISFTYFTVKNFGSFVHTGNDEIRDSRERAAGRQMFFISGPQKVAE